jgi:hypothetical protein
MNVNEEINHFDHFTNLMNGMWIGKLSKSFKEVQKRNSKKQFFYEVIRNQFNFGPNIETSYIKNKQAFNVNLRKKIDAFSPDNALKYINSKAIVEFVNKESSDLIIDCSGVIATPNGLTDWYINISYNFHYQSQFLDFINFDIEDMLKATEVPYNKEFFLVGVKNSDKFLSSIIAAYIEVFPDVFPELFKEHSYDAFLVMFPKVINCFNYKNHYLESDEQMKLYVNKFFNNYVQFDPEIENYIKQFLKPKKDH